MTVPPKAFLTALKSPSSDTTVAKRRCGPISTFSGVDGAGFRPAQTISPMPSAATRASASARSGVRSAAIAFAVTDMEAFAMPTAPALTRSTGLGSGSAIHGSRSSSTGVGSGPRSKRTVARSTPAIPSIIAWWAFVSRPKLPSSSPSMSHISHSGLERSSCWENTRATRFWSCSWLPGDGSAVWRTWYSRLKSVSSVHSGRAEFAGGNTSRWR